MMNELFVNIKVDREERPDLDDIYMGAVHAMTGNDGRPMTLLRENATLTTAEANFGATDLPRPLCRWWRSAPRHGAGARVGQRCV